GRRGSRGPAGGSAAAVRQLLLGRRRLRSRHPAGRRPADQTLRTSGTKGNDRSMSTSTKNRYESSDPSTDETSAVEKPDSQSTVPHRLRSSLTQNRAHLA